MENWSDCRNILCIRPDNMGDLVMSGPAIRALKKTFSAKITVLTSSAGAAVAKLMPCIDEVIIYDLPWVKNDQHADASSVNIIVKHLADKQFDAAVVFTVYSQNPLPTVMLAYLAGISKRLAYCRENPYQLLTNWVPDREPYSYIKHQVSRDLDLVLSIGAIVDDDRLELLYDPDTVSSVIEKLLKVGLDLQKPWLVFHPGVSEKKREYPESNWIAAGKLAIIELGYQVFITGVHAEKQLTQNIQTGIGAGSFDVNELFNLAEFITLISIAGIIISVNTGTVHIAAALNKPIVVLYALTNPQHTPWKTPCKILPYTVDVDLRSKNEVIRYVNDLLYREPVTIPDPAKIIEAIKELTGPHRDFNSDFFSNRLPGFEGAMWPGQALVESQAGLTS